VEAYERALRLQPALPIALNNLGNSLRYLGRIEESDHRFQQAIDLKPDYFNAYRNRGTLHAWTGRIDLALKYYADAMRLHPQDAAALGSAPEGIEIRADSALAPGDVILEGPAGRVDARASTRLGQVLAGAESP
jgi:tetratricopeptide (TPR) repeat protein